MSQRRVRIAGRALLVVAALALMMLIGPDMGPPTFAQAARATRRMPPEQRRPRRARVVSRRRAARVNYSESFAY
jgi:hypothetical protein